MNGKGPLGNGWIRLFRRREQVDSAVRRRETRKTEGRGKAYGGGFKSGGKQGCAGF